MICCQTSTYNLSDVAYTVTECSNQNLKFIASEAKRSELAREPPVTVWEKETTAYLENEAF